MDNNNKPESKFNFIQFGTKKIDSEKLKNQANETKDNPFANFSGQNSHDENHSAPFYEEFFTNSLNTISSDQHEGRMLRKNLIFLGVSSLLTIIFYILGLNFIKINPIFWLLPLIVLPTINNILFITLSNKHLVWAKLGIDTIILFLCIIFTGTLFNVINLIVLIILAFINLLAFSEVERHQMGVRIFNLKLITAESTRLISHFGILCLALGVFNSVVSVGAGTFISKNIISNKTVYSYIFKPGEKTAILGNILLKDIDDYEAKAPDYQVKTLYSYVEKNYKTPGILDEELDAKVSGCKKESIKPVCVDAKNLLFADFVKKTYDVDSNATTLVKTDLIQNMVKNYYATTINNFSAAERVEFLPKPIATTLDNKTIIPAVIATLLYAILLSISGIWIFMSNFITSLVWAALVKSGFVKIEVEMAEVESVSI